jgi:hypothetical protein
MNTFFRRVLPVLLLSMVAAACATTEPPVATRPAGATPPSIDGSWVPRGDIASNFRAAKGGILNAEIRGDVAVVTWAGKDEKITLVRPRLRTVAADGGGEWTGAVTLDSGTPANLTLKCPAPQTNERGRPYMVCRSLVQGNQLHDNPLLLLRAQTPARAPANR